MAYEFYRVRRYNSQKSLKKSGFMYKYVPKLANDC